MPNIRFFHKHRLILVLVISMHMQGAWFTKQTIKNLLYVTQFSMWCFCTKEKKIEIASSWYFSCFLSLQVHDILRFNWHLPMRTEYFWEMVCIDRKIVFASMQVRLYFLRGYFCQRNLMLIRGWTFHQKHTGENVFLST